MLLGLQSKSMVGGWGWGGWQAPLNYLLWEEPLPFANKHVEVQTPSTSEWDAGNQAFTEVS